MDIFTQGYLVPFFLKKNDEDHLCEELFSVHIFVTVIQKCKKKQTRGLTFSIHN